MLGRISRGFTDRLFSDGATIVAVGHFAKAGIRLVSNLILTRLLYPEAFGLMSIIGTVLTFLALLSDLGYHAFFIRHRSEGPKLLDTIWSVRLIRSFVLAGVLGLISYPVALFYGHPELFAALLVVALFNIVGGFDAMSLMVAQRDQRFFKFSIVDVSLQLIQTVATILLAVILRNYWALVIGGAMSTIFGMIFSYTLFPGSARRFRIDKEVVRELWAFARIVMPSSVITLILTQSDKLIIAKLFDIRLLGVYAIATTMTSFFNEFAQRIIYTVMFPRFSKANREAPETLSDVYYRERGKLFPKFLLLCGFTVPLGGLIFRILYDYRYIEGGLYFSILMAAPILRAISFSSEQVLIVKGQIRATLEGNIIRILWFFGTIFVFFHYFGLIGIIVSVAFIDLPPLVVYWWRMRREGLLNVRREASDIRYLVAGLALGVVANELLSYALSLVRG